VLLVGRDTKSGALVRYHALPRDHSPTEGPETITRDIKSRVIWGLPVVVLGRHRCPEFS
jgi:hypothetical protein